MRLADRLQRLERTLPPPLCPVCALTPEFTVVDATTPPPAPCPACGAVPFVFTLDLHAARPRPTDPVG
jgi:hypothetical protein